MATFDISFVNFPRHSKPASFKSLRRPMSTVQCQKRCELQGISGEEQFEQVLRNAQDNDAVVVIEWMANWCRKCIYLKPQLEKLAWEFQQGAKFYFVDVNAVPQALVKRAGITKMPTVQLWKDNEMKGEVVGGQKAEMVVSEVRHMLQAT